MTDICPRCLQSLPHEKENEVESDLETLIQVADDGTLLGLWGKVSFVTSDDIDKRKHVELHAGHMEMFIRVLQLRRSFESIDIYDSLGTGPGDSEFTTNSEEVEE